MTLTGEDQGEDTHSPIELILYGDKGQSQPLVLGEGKDFKFKRGSSDTFSVSFTFDLVMGKHVSVLQIILTTISTGTCPNET